MSGPATSGAGGPEPGAAPPLAELLRWMREMPEPFRFVPEGFGGSHAGRVRVRAVVADLIEALRGEPPDAPLLQAFDPAGAGKLERNRLQWVLAGCHLLWHPELRTPVEEARVRRFLVQDLAALAAAVPADAVTRDDERREELIRLALRALGLRLPGESAREAEDRLAQVDSVERRALAARMADREKRAREVREQMAKRAAEEAAAKVSRE
jgi:hypothetical protein